MFRVDRDEWRAVWPLAIHLGVQSAEMWDGYAWTAEGTLEAWAAAAREAAGRNIGTCGAGDNPVPTGSQPG